MNMNNNPTKEQLRTIVHACDDMAGHHILWVDGLGEVHITLLVNEVPAAWAGKMEAQIRFRYETYDPGNDYVGPKAASDDQYVSLLFDKLLKDWQDNRRGYLDT